MSNKSTALQVIDKMKSIVSSQSVKDQFKNALGKHADLFTASIISVYSSDSYLQNCEPGLVVKEALKAAILKLPIEKNLGFAYIIPYKVKGVLTPTFQLGYKGLIQLAMRTGQVKTINDGPIWEGETVTVDRLSGKFTITGESKNENAIGYFGFFELNNGYTKAEYWTKEKVITHAQQYSQSYRSKNKIWIDEFDKQASKTVLAHILNKYAPKSVEFLLSAGNDSNEQSPETEEFETIPIKNLMEEKKPEQNQEPALDDVDLTSDDDDPGFGND